mmetsp:Transcript_74640/g.213837  ORF Transcript_74640/g.213837 Transcript_74640/m.213837 type:complete len:317 (+) Transcript_74640:1006-1956(+)
MRCSILLGLLLVLSDLTCPSKLSPLCGHAREGNRCLTALVDPHSLALDVILRQRPFQDFAEGRVQSHHVGASIRGRGGTGQASIGGLPLLTLGGGGSSLESGNFCGVVRHRRSCSILFCLLGLCGHLTGKCQATHARESHCRLKLVAILLNREGNVILRDHLLELLLAELVELTLRVRMRGSHKLFGLFLLLLLLLHRMLHLLRHAPSPIRVLGHLLRGRRCDKHGSRMHTVVRQCCDSGILLRDLGIGSHLAGELDPAKAYERHCRLMLLAILRNGVSDVPLRNGPLGVLLEERVQQRLRVKLLSHAWDPSRKSF